MSVLTHSLIKTFSGDAVQITFTLKDKAGNTVSVVGASATYKIARRAGDTALLGDFIGQLKITKSGDSLIVAEGLIVIAPAIL